MKKNSTLQKGNFQERNSLKFARIVVENHVFNQGFNERDFMATVSIIAVNLCALGREEPDQLKVTAFENEPTQSSVVHTAHQSSSDPCSACALQRSYGRGSAAYVETEKSATSERRYRKH